MKNLLVLLAIAAMLATPLLGQGESDTIWTIMTRPKQCGGTKFTPDGHSIVAAVGDKIHEYEVQTGELIRVFDGSKSTIRTGQLEISSTGGKVVACDEKGHAMMWDYETGKLDTVLNYIIDIYEGATCVAISPDDKYFFIGLNGMPDDHYSNTVIYDIEMKKEILQISNKGRTRELAISQDGKYLAIGSVEQSQPNADTYGLVTLWNAETWEPIKELSYLKGMMRDLDFSPDNTMLAVAQRDGTVRLWDVQTQQLIYTFSTYINTHKLKFSRDSKFLAFGIEELVEWNTKISKIDTKELVYKYSQGLSTDLDISYDNTKICGSSGSRIYILHARWEPDGIKEDNENHNELYPNPVDGIITFSLMIPDPANLFIHVFNETGIKVIEKDYGFINAGINEVTLQTSELPSGIYFIKAFAGENVYEFKFVVKR